MRPLFRFALTITLIVLVGCVTPQPPGPPNTPLPRIMLDNPGAPFQAHLASPVSSLVIGETLSLSVSADVESYLSLYAIGSSGKSLELLANQPAEGGRTQSFPSAGEAQRYELSPPPGAESYILVATLTPLMWLQPADIQSQQNGYRELSLRDAQLVERLRAALTARPANSWDVAVLSLPLITPVAIN